MNTKTITFFSVLALLFASVGTRAVAAQSNKITCESTGGDYNYCRVDTDNVVKLETKLSLSECRYNFSWGYDRRGIWVDRGCRAEFAYGRSSSTTALAAGAIIGGAILAGVLASRGNDRAEVRDANGAYNYGYNQGRNDALRGESNNPARYDQNVVSNFRNEYRNGYTNGYRSGSDSNNYPSYGISGGADQRSAYQRGYNAGRNDATRHRSSDFTRYRSEFDRNTRQSFRNGYDTGFSSVDNAGYRPGNSASRVPNWLIGTWEADQGVQRLHYSFTSSGSVTIETIPRRGRRTQASGYYSNGAVVIPNFTSYDVRRQGGQIVLVNVKNSNDRTVFRRIR